MTGRLTWGASPTVTCGLREIDMSSSYHQPDAGASLPGADLDTLAARLSGMDLDNLAHVLTRHPRYAVKPGMKLAAAGRAWRVTHRAQPPPFPDTWLPVLADPATAGVLLDWLVLEADGVGAERCRINGGGLRWHVTAHRAGELRAAEHGEFGVAVALVLLALGGAE